MCNVHKKYFVNYFLNDIFFHYLPEEKFIRDLKYLYIFLMLGAEDIPRRIMVTWNINGTVASRPKTNIKNIKIY